MKQVLDRVTHWLFEASAAIPHDYFALPVAAQEVSIYRERVYCYELYHQWRCRWEPGFAYSLAGEIDKAGHPLIRRRSKPDFLVHVPGAMTNLLTVEVKSANPDSKGMVKDLKTLSCFRRGLGNAENYFAAYIWLYGVDEPAWRDLASDLARRTRNDAEVDLGLIQPVIHIRAREAAKFMAWNT